jgi:hypothetical protein
MSSVMRGRSVGMHRSPVCAVVKRQEVWFPNPPAIGDQQSQAQVSLLPALGAQFNSLRFQPPSGRPAPFM